MERPITCQGERSNTAKVNWSIVWLSSWTIVGVFFLVKALGGAAFGTVQPASVPAVESPLELNDTQPKIRFAKTQGVGWKTKNIEDIRVGDRVLADNPEIDSPDESRVDPATWRHIKLRAETRCDDGALDTINVETLQPPEWVAAHHVQVGATVPLPVEATEMGLPEGLKGKVIANNPCPPIRAGPGHVVLMTVNHFNNDLRELTVEDARGRRETVRPTGLHKFYRPSDGFWVSAKDLWPGSRLHGTNGFLTVVGNKTLPGVHRVYNMTVEGEHVYHVSSLGALAHNNGCAVAGPVSPLPGSYINTRFTINMAGAPAGSATNAAGHARNGPWFWRQMLRNHPALFSPANRARIGNRIAPRVDDVWVAQNATHRSFMRDTLIHHHIDQGAIATPLPQRVHRAWHGTLHPER